MEPELPIVVGIIGVVTTIVAALLGYLSERSALGIIVLGLFTAIACGLCFAGIQFGGWFGLLAAILVVTLLAYRVGRGFGKQRGAVFVPALWLGFCGSCAIGYWANGWLGLLTITLPSLLIFWGSLFGISQSLLPLKGNSQRGKAFRSLLTFSLGTNYPYHVFKDRELVERVSGNPFGQFFAGPGIVLTGPAHAPIIWNGLQFKRIGNPGLSFTERFESIYQTVDLRPQLRSFFIDAITKDGIRIRVLTFIPFKLKTEGQGPSPTGSFPQDNDSIYKAVWKQPVEQERRTSWDEVVPIMATRILRKIISECRCDELCECFNPKADPRSEIKTKLVEQLSRELEEWGIEVIGGGISNLLPVDDSIVSKRIDAWRAQWERQIMVTIGEGRANAIWEMEKAHAQAQVGLISAIRHVIEQEPSVNPDILANMAALRFIEALEEMACRPGVQEALSVDTGVTMAYLRQALGHEGP